MSSTFALSTSIPSFEIAWPSTIPFFTIKWYFSQLSTRFVPAHLSRTSERFSRHKSKEEPYTLKSSINISMQRSTMSKKYSTCIAERWLEHCIAQKAYVDRHTYRRGK